MRRSRKPKGYEKAYKFLASWFKKHRNIYASDIATGLSMQYNQVLRIIDRMQKDGIVEFVT